MNAKESISILFEPPKPKSKYNIDIKSVEEGRWCRNRKITLASGGRIINNFKDIEVEKFGKTYEIKEVNLGTKNDKVIIKKQTILHP